MLPDEFTSRSYYFLCSPCGGGVIAARHVIRSERDAFACAPHFATDYSYFSADGAPRARIALLPGLDGGVSRFLSAPIMQTLVDDFAARGYDVVVLDVPLPKPCWFADGGAKYRAVYLRALDSVLSDVTTKYGARAKTLITGISYGGLHAMMGYAQRPGEFVGWQAGFSVTKLDALTELKSVGEVPDFDPFNQIEWLRGSTGYLTWGSEDMRVDHREAEKLYALIRSPRIVGIDYQGETHETTMPMISDILRDADRQVTSEPSSDNTKGAATGLPPSTPP